MVRSYDTVQPVPFGSYQLVERLAMGGMAEVYLARPDGQPRFVALKRILPNIAADDEFIAMFIDEAKIAGQLNHPNVAQIFDLGKINNSYFIAMEYVSGHDLRALWDRTRDADGGKNALPIGLACYIVKKICDGLDYAHRRRDGKGRPLGIIHRDVSPQNILVSYDGDLKIIDFGIAKAANRIVKTQTGILKGKFAYMAPEQARGEPTDHRADIFAIGVILYELLTGERTFKADSDFALLEKVRRVDTASPRSLRSEIPKDLERIIFKALAKEAGDRYAWASALGSDLDRFMSDQGWASSKEELGAFLQRTFREEFREEQKRLAGYKSLFADDEVSGTNMRSARGGSDAGSEDGSSGSSDGTAVGEAVGESNVATSFEDGGPTSATAQVMEAAKAAKAAAAKKPSGPAPAAPASSKNKNAPGPPPGDAQILELRDKAARIAQGKLSEMSQSSSSLGLGTSTTGAQAGASSSSSLMASMPDQSVSGSGRDKRGIAPKMNGAAKPPNARVDAKADDDDDEIDDDEIDASAEASAMGLPVASEPPRAGPPKRGSAASRRANVDETQIDPDTNLGDSLQATGAVPGKSGPPAIVARDEMPKKLRVVANGSNGGSARQQAAEGPGAAAAAQPPPIPNTTGSGTQSSQLSSLSSLQASQLSAASASPSSSVSAFSEGSQPRDRPDRNDRNERNERNDRNDPRNERSGLSRASPMPPPPAAPARPATVPIVIAALLGVVIGAGVVGIVWLAMQSPTTTVMFVATPRQTEVRLGDEVLCTQTPCAVLLEPGKHEIRFKAPGAEQLSRTVEVKAEGTAPVEVILERTRNDVRIETNPPGATIILDDKQLEHATPTTLPPLVVGKLVRLKIVHEGFEPFEVNRTVDEEPMWRYELPSSFTAWTISADPPDALIDGPGKDLPGNKLIVTAGTKKGVVVKFQRPGCQPRSVSLLANGKAEAEQKVVLDCKPIDSGLFIQAPKRSTIKIDNIELPRTAKLDPYPLPSGTWNIVIKSPRGKSELQTVELRSKQPNTLVSKLK